MEENTTAAATWQEPTAAKIAEWKKAHDIEEIHVLKAVDPKDKVTKKAYCRPPSMEDLTRASKSNKDKPGTYNQSLLANCMLDCHPDVMKSQALYQGMVFAMDKIIIAADVEVEKL
ncbi:hypothetical protein [Aurantibacillus circumpalustris]|uniref:hypothetical protein n=1 Tax=Aurantibacillus circumpalustris TaxID=3036359 RepID=UPI00295C1B0F|nr:hypothetical protein [Aurantibacillus circumpalustris]